MQSACSVCNSPTIQESQFCSRHDRAHEQLESAFVKWQVAYGRELNRKAFLERVLQFPETGQKVREVIRFLLEKDQS